MPGRSSWHAYGQEPAEEPIYLPLIINDNQSGAIALIEAVTLDTQQVCAGESVHVQVETNRPDDTQASPEVSINGQPGASQHIQFAGVAGPRLMEIVAVSGDTIDTRQASVEVIACPDHAPFPIVTTRANPYHEETVDFDITNADAFRDLNPTYVWDFGDGQTEQTTLPRASHDYTAALLTDERYTVFPVQVTVQPDPGDPISTTTSVTLHSSYALTRQRGFVQLPVESGSTRVRLAQNGVGEMTITNPEQEAIELTQWQVEYQFCDPARQPATPDPEPYSVQVPGKQQITVQIAVPADRLSSDVCGIGVHLIGQSADGLPAFASRYIDVRQNTTLVERERDTAMIAMIKDVIDRGLVDDPTSITEADLDRLARAGQIIYPPEPGAHLSDTGDSVAQHHLGERCTPGARPPRDGMSCQVTDEVYVAPPRIANARKGDILLSPGCGIVGSMLRQVSPPQQYTHAGIMTADYYEVTHATASDEAITHAISDGLLDKVAFNTNALRYGWPGVITQSIDEAFNGQRLLNPADNRYYTLTSFSFDPVWCHQDHSISYPLVVKPMPGADPSVRERLHQAADVARNTRGHYRFYAYSNAAIAQDRHFDGSPDAGWARDSLAAVCSTFIWYVLKRVGIELEGNDLEPTDRSNGALRDDQTADGLYLYTAAERRSAARQFYADIYNQAYDQAGFLGELLKDAPDNLGNQMVNCFAYDRCNREATEFDGWRSDPGSGRTVSPDDILFWDAPPTGVYGYSEPLIYRGAEYQPVFRWSPTGDAGTISGRVRIDGSPVSNATVVVQGPNLETSTDASGGFTFSAIPAGYYRLEAQKIIDGLLYTASSTVTISPGTTSDVTLTLVPPPDIYRQVTIQGTMHIKDSETFGKDTIRDVRIFHTVRLNPWQRHAVAKVRSGCIGGEVKVEIDLSFELQSDNTTIRVTGESRLYEDGGGCAHNDLEERRSFNPVLIGPNQGATYEYRQNNRELGGGDYAAIAFTIWNNQQP
jgi:hypothetical protein